MNVNLILSKEKYHIGFFDSFAMYLESVSDLQEL